MTFEEFQEYCSFDFNQLSAGTEVIVIFSSAFRKNFSTAFYKSNTEVANKLTAHDLYDYMKELFNG